MPRQLHSSLPVCGLNPRRRPCTLTTSSWRSPTSTRMGEAHDRDIPLVFHSSLPSFLVSATSEPLSTLALTSTRSLKRTGEVALPQLCVPVPTLVCQSCLPSRSKASTPDFPKKT